MASMDDGDFIQMSSATADVSTARRLIVRLEDSEAERRRESIAQVRPFVASRLKTAPGTLENIRRYRSKVIPNWLMERIRAEFIKLLQSEIQGLEHEIQLARQTGADHRDDTLASAESQLASARAILANET